VDCVQALEFRRTGKLPDSFTAAAMIEQEEPKTPKESQSNGAHTQIECCFVNPISLFESEMLNSMLTVYVRSSSLIN